MINKEIENEYRYELSEEPNKKGGCTIASVLLIITALMIATSLFSCTKDECVKPVERPIKGRFCMDCKPSTINPVDTTVRKNK